MLMREMGTGSLELGGCVRVWDVACEEDEIGSDMDGRLFTLCVIVAL